MVRVGRRTTPARGSAKRVVSDAQFVSLGLRGRLFSGLVAQARGRTTGYATLAPELARLPPRNVREERSRRSPREEIVDQCGIALSWVRSGPRAQVGLSASMLSVHFPVLGKNESHDQKTYDCFGCSGRVL